jgi:hypothetical protein
LFFIEQWIVLTSKKADRDHPALDDFKPLMPPPDRDWADPFPWNHEGRTYIFIEEKPFSVEHGYITCLAMDDKMNVTSSDIVLKRPYHLSYPFLFKYNDQIYMMPETLGNRAVELYRCVRFPDQWEFFKTLIPNLNAVDATLVERHGKWWLFTIIKDEDGLTWNTLCLYFADSPLSDSWTPHPRNPIVRDIRSARPAGGILRGLDGGLIRPSQDCSRRYGYATNFMRISTLTETDYAESLEHTFKPPARRNILGIHTWNEMDGLTVIDATLRRRKP